MTETRINWHSAMLSALRIELAEYEDILSYESEIILNSGQRRADILITKEENSRPVSTPIGKQFRKYNLIEYKGPDDTLSAIAFYKALSYMYSFPELYNTVHVMDEISLTLISHSFPRNLLKYIKSRPLHPLRKNAKNVLAKIIPGLYSINNEEIPVQLVVTSQLPKQEYIWLCALTNHLTSPELLIPVSSICKKHQNDPDYKNYMDTIIRANRQTKGENTAMMCEALDELFADEIKQEWEKGKAEGLIEGKKEGKKEGKIEGIAVGKTEGRLLGLDSFSALMNCLFQENRIADAKRAASEPAFRDMLLEEYQLT